MVVVDGVNHIVDIVLQNEANIFPQRCIVILIVVIVCIIIQNLFPLQWEVCLRLILLLLGNVEGSLALKTAMPCLLFALKHNGLILVDPALILDLAFDHVVSMHRSYDRTYAAHVKE